MTVCGISPCSKPGRNSFCGRCRRATPARTRFLRRLQNFALDMSWLPWPVLPKKRWPVVRFKGSAASLGRNTRKILAGESNHELRAYYDLLW